MQNLNNNIRNVPENLERNMGRSVPSLRTVAVAGGGAIATAATIGAGATIGAVVGNIEHLSPNTYRSVLCIIGSCAVVGAVAGVFVDKMINGNDDATDATVLSQESYQSGAESHQQGDVELQAQRPANA